MPDNIPVITIDNLISALKAPLPGASAHTTMLPKGRKLDYDSNKPNIKKSAVLMLIYPNNGELFFCLTKRNAKLKHHPGQISFPGGKCEKHEIDTVETALRETEEEIGIERNHIQILGRLSDVYVSVSNFIIHPYIGYISRKPDFKINRKEVDELIVLPLNSILNMANRTERDIETSIGVLRVSCYLINDYVIWGATSMMIAELEALLRKHYSHRGAH